MLFARCIGGVGRGSCAEATAAAEARYWGPQGDPGQRRAALTRAHIAAARQAPDLQVGLVMPFKAKVDSQEVEEAGSPDLQVGSIIPFKAEVVCNEVEEAGADAPQAGHTLFVPKARSLLNDAKEARGAGPAHGALCGISAAV